MLFRSTCSFLAPRKILGHMKDQLAGITKNLDVVQGCVTLISSSLKKKKHEKYTFNSHPLFCQKSSNIWQICSSLRWMWTYIYTCGLPASAVAIISGWGGLEMWGTGALTGSPRGRRTHKVVTYLIFVIFFTQPQFATWKFYTWKCVNLVQKLPRDKTA